MVSLPGGGGIIQLHMKVLGSKAALENTKIKSVLFAYLIEKINADLLVCRKHKCDRHNHKLFADYSLRTN